MEFSPNQQKNSFTEPCFFLSPRRRRMHSCLSLPGYRHLPIVILVLSSCMLFLAEFDTRHISNAAFLYLHYSAEEAPHYWFAHAVSLFDLLLSAVLLPGALEWFYSSCLCSPVCFRRPCVPNARTPSIRHSVCPPRKQGNLSLSTGNSR